MKMTDADERALAVMQFARGYLTWNNMQEFDDALQHIRARLAADQQKGGGDTVRSDGATQCADCGGWNLHDCPPCCDTPQTSIPAPAQQLEGMRDLAKQWRRDAESCRRDGYTDAAVVKEDCAFALSQLLGMSPAQQDGKASGGEESA